MASFDITAQINLRGPTNVKKIAADIRKQLGAIKTNVDLKIDPSTAKNVSALNSNFKQLDATLRKVTVSAKDVATQLGAIGTSLNSINSAANTTTNNLNQMQNASQKVATATKQVSKNAQNAATGLQKFGKDAGGAIKRIIGFRIGSAIFNGLTSSISDGVAKFIEFERALAKVQQVTGSTNLQIENLSRSILDFSKATGAAASSLAEVSVVLSQAGLSARETETALEALANTTLAPTFGDIKETAEGAIAILRQFGLEAEDLNDALGSINAVAGQFAVSASDVIVAVKQAGAVFASSSKGVAESEEVFRQFIATFTSVRQTTRESAETIGTGLKTIVTRLQRLDTIESLKKFGIQLTDLEGKFVGPFEAIRRLSEGLQNLDPRDIRFGAIIEELGGFRQVGKVIPLIQQYTVAQEALKTAQEGTGSIADQAIIAQATLGKQLDKTAASFQSLITTISNNESLQTIAKTILSIANAAFTLAEALSDVLPALLAISAVPIGKALAGAGSSFLSGFLGKNQGGPIPFARGGYVPGQGNRDTVPAMLTPGEFVIRKKAVEAIGVDKLGAMNNGAGPVAQAKNLGGRIQKFQTGGEVQVDYVGSQPTTEEEQRFIGDNMVKAVKSLAGFYAKKSKVPVADAKGAVSTDATALPNYKSIVGGVFEAAIDAVAATNRNYTNEKLANNAVWDYPQGLPESNLFSTVGGQGYPVDAKKNPSKDTILKKVEAHYRNAEGSELNRTKFGIVTYEEGNDRSIAFDAAAIKANTAEARDRIKERKKNAVSSQKAHYGGLIQRLAEGDEVLAISKNGRITKADIAAATSKQLEEALKNPTVQNNPSTVQAVKAELVKRGRESKAENLGVVGILPINYSKDLPVANYGGTFAKIHARGLPKKYEETVLNISKGLRGVVDEAAKNLGDGNTKKLTPEQEKATGLENVQGTIFEAVLSALGAKGGTIQNQAIDYQNGLGPAAKIFPGIGPDWPTEVKRDVTGAGMSRAKGEFTRFFKERAQAKNLGGIIKMFADGGNIPASDTVPAMLTPGEFVINKKAAKRIGLPKLRQMNYADRVKGFNKGGPVGGIQYFNNGGSPNTDPSVAFANTGGALGAQAAKTNAQAANVNLQAANANANTANQNSQTASKNSNSANTNATAAQKNSGLGKEILIAFSGPAFKAAITGAFPTSEFAAGAGEAASQGVTQGSAFKNLTAAAGEGLGKFGGIIGRTGALLTKLAGPVGVAIGVFSAFSGFLDGQLRKSIENLSKKLDDAGKEAEDAFKKLGPLLVDRNADQKAYNAVLTEGAAALRDQAKIARQLAEERIQQNNGGYFGAAYRAVGLEGESGRELREAQNRTVERETFQGAADQAEKVLIDIVNSGKTLDEAFEGVPDQLDAYKEAIALSSEKYRKESAELQKLIDAAPQGSKARQLYEQQLRELRDAAVEEKGSRLKTAQLLKQQEKLYAENAKALALATTSIKRTIQNFDSALIIAGDRFDSLSKEAESAAKGFAGVVPEDIFAQNITVIQNPERFSGSENRAAITPLSGILGDSASFFEEFQTLPGKLEDAILSVASTPGIDNAEQAGEATQAAVLRIVEESFGGSQVGNAVAASIREAIEKATPKDGKGQFDAAALINKVNEITKDSQQSFGDSAAKALDDFQKQIGQTAKFAENAAIALGRFKNSIDQSINSQKALNQELRQLVGGPAAQGPESIRSINSRTVDSAKQNVTGGGDFAAQKASLEKQLLEASLEQTKIMTDANGIDQQLNQENSMKLGELRGEILTLQANTKNLQAALSSKLEGLKGALGKRLQELKEQEAASENLFERLLQDEGQTNTDIIRAQRVAAGQDVGNLSGDQAVKVLRDIVTLQKAGLIAETKQVEQNKVRVLARARGLGERTAAGRQVFNAVARVAPEEDDKVREYVREIQQTNAELNAVSVALASNDLIDANAGLEKALEAQTAATVELAKRFGDYTKQDEAQNINPPTKANGGIIYRSRGGGTQKGINWQPRGTDTIPAMLTPGEFVVNAKSTKANRGLLESINSSGSTPSKSYSKGGILYRQGGGGTSSPADEKTLWDKIQLMLKGGNAVNIMSLGWTNADEIAEFATKWTTMPKWLSGWKNTINTNIASKWSTFKDYAVSGLTKNIKAPQWILDAGANGLINPDTMDDAIRAGNPKTWKNLIPRAIGRVAQSRYATIAKNWSSTAWNAAQLKLANLGSVKWIQNLGNISSSPIIKSITGTVGKGLSKGLGFLGIAEHLYSGIEAGIDRTETLQQADASTSQILISSVAEILAGGTAPAPDNDSYQAVLGAGFQNNLRLLSAIGTGASTGGLPGAVAAAATVAVGQGIRLGEETIGWLGDLNQLSQDVATTERIDENAVQDNLQSGRVSNTIRKPYEIIGELQHSRARSVGRKLSYKDWYKQNQGLFDSLADYDADLDSSNDLGMYSKSKLDFAFKKLAESTDLTFDPNLRPSNRGFWDGYNDQDYQNAYAEVVAHYNKNGPVEPLAWEYPNSASDEGKISPDANELVDGKKTKAQDIMDELFGNEDKGLKPQLDKYEKDAKMMQIAEDRSKIYDQQGQLVNNMILSQGGSKESQWLNAELQTIEALRANNILRDNRKEELKLQELKRQEEEKAAKKREQEQIKDQNSKTSQTITNLGLANKGFKLSTTYPYMTNRKLVKELQENSIRMRLELEKQQTFNSKGELKGPPLGAYLDFLTGKYTPNDLLVKSDAERDYLINLGSAIDAYRNNYKQAAPFYADAVNPKQFDDFRKRKPEREHEFAFSSFFKNNGDTPDPIEGDLVQNAGKSLSSLYRVGIIKALGGTLKAEDAATMNQETFDKERAKQRKAREDQTPLTEDEVNKIYEQAKAEATKKINDDGSVNLQGYYNELGLMVGETMTKAENAFFGYNFYTAGGTPGPQTAPDDGAVSNGLVAMANLVPNDQLLYPGFYGGAASKLPFNKLKLEYITKLDDLRKARTVDSEQDFKLTREQEKEDNRKKASEQKKRLRAVENYTKVNLLGSAVPKDPLGYLEFRQEQSKKFAAAVNNLPGESYPMPTDLPAFKEAGVSSKWVKRLFTLRDSDLVNNINPETAKALLYWKAQFDNGFASPEDLIGRATNFDGNLGLDDIYPKELQAGNPGEAAAGDLSKIAERIASAGEDLNKIKGGATTKDAAGRRLLERSMIKLKTAGLWNPESPVTDNLNSIRALSGVNLPLETFFENYDIDDLYNKEKWKSATVQRLASGGPVMGGVFTPRGSDTVPAMLTPGEYVVNRKAAQANKPLLEAINGTRGRNSKKGYYDRGGEVSDGVNNIIAIDVQEISAFVQSFDRFSKELANLKIPSEITVQGTHTVEVNVNGAQVLNDLLNGPIGELVSNEIQLAFQQQNIESEGSIPNPFA